MIDRRSLFGAGAALVAAPGGNADPIARILPPRLQDRLGQPLVVENRPGAGLRSAGITAQ